MRKREQAYEFIRRLILAGSLPAGETTSERDIQLKAEGLGVSISRTPIREALAVLASTGLIEQVPQVGARVRSIDEAEAIRSLKLRGSMEAVMVDELASHQQPKVDGASAALARMGDVGDDPLAFQLADTEFHVAIAVGAGFFSARTSLEGLRDRIHLYRLADGLDKVPVGLVLAEHGAMLERIDDGDRQGAVEALERHLIASATRIVPGIDGDAFLGQGSIAVAEQLAAPLSIASAKS